MTVRRVDPEKIRSHMSTARKFRNVLHTLITPCISRTKCSSSSYGGPQSLIPIRPAGPRRRSDRELLFANTAFSHFLSAAHGGIAAGIDLLVVNPKSHPVIRQGRALVIHAQPFLVPLVPEPPGIVR